MKRERVVQLLFVALLIVSWAIFFCVYFFPRAGVVHDLKSIGTFLAALLVLHALYDLQRDLRAWWATWWRA